MAILTQAWPSDLDPQRVPYQRRTITTLQRMGAWNDSKRFAELTVAEVAGFWVTGPVTVADLIDTSEEAIEWHRGEGRALAAFAEGEPWTCQVWHRDRRFSDLLPRVEATVYDIAARGHHRDQRHLYRVLPELGRRLDAFAGEPRDEALIRYVSANTGQSEPRTVALLQRLGLLTPTINGSEAGRQLGISPQRVHQLVGQIRYRIGVAQPPGDATGWLPQDPQAIQSVLK